MEGTARSDEILHPVVPGFERFHRDADIDPAAGGRLLIAELSCTACHTLDGSAAAWVSPKPAPILDAVASRVKPQYLRRYLSDPQSVDAGTTMPHLFEGVPSALRDEQVEALVHFLSSGGSIAEAKSDVGATRRGNRLFHTIGCAVCHGEQREEAPQVATTIPLADLGAKYSTVSLAEFLRNPHAVRPGGRMPSFDLEEEQAKDIAHFLIPGENATPKAPRITYKIYRGSYSNLPDFSTLEPVAEGEADDFDIRIAGENRNYAIVFEGFLKIERAGEYWFRIGSDDGSRLLIDGDEVANHDGVHAYSTVRGAKEMKAGVYPLRLEYAQVAGEQKLTLQVEGPELPSQSAINLTYLTAEAVVSKPKVEKAKESEEAAFVLDASLVEKGRGLFASLGCASCHQVKVGEATLTSSRQAPAAASLSLEKGCLSEAPAAPAVDYGLSKKQRASIVAAFRQLPDGKPSEAERIDMALVQFNCYACHERNGKGGVEAERNEVFTTSIPEMGDEGRIPPHLTGAGDKLKVEWLRQLLGKGANDRTYMRTRMPSFGSENVGFLADAFAAVDRRDEVTVPEVELPEHRIVSVGRELVGETALSCIKCHNFGEYSGTGIQAVNLQTMTRRLREDWFFRYMPDPQQYRPGTRMPSAFPNGKSVVRGILDGNANQQLASIWQYLDLGSKAPIPAGTVSSAIVLTPSDRPIVYRGFLEGVSTRAIAVGYPEKANIVFDAEQMCLAQVWHHEFIDASKHWVGRGSGAQRPAGDHLLSQVRGVPLAVLENDSTAWPGAPAKEQGWEFRGYALDAKGRPTFRYGSEVWEVEDTPQPIAAKDAGSLDAVLHRSIRVAAKSGETLPERLYFRAAAGGTIEKIGGNNYRIDDSFTLRFPVDPDAAMPVVRESEGKKELLVPVGGNRSSHVIEIDYEW